MSDMKKKQSHHRRTLLSWLRHAFIAGILVTMPFILTIAVAKWLIDYIDSKVVPLLPNNWGLGNIIADIPGIGVVILVVGLTLIGGLTGGFIGRAVVGFFENLLSRTPLRVFYNTIKQILQSVLKGQSNAFKKPAMIEYPRKGVWAVAFITNEKSDAYLTKSTGAKNLVSVFLPTTPNPTSGFLLLVPRQELRELDMSVEQAIRLVISAGIVTEEEQTVSVKSAKAKAAKSQKSAKAKTVKRKN